MEYTRDVSSPEMFRLWTAIHAIGAAAERRVWTQLGINQLFPNLFVFLVGPPGSGKTQALNPMSKLLRKSQAVGLAPNDMSKQGLLDCLKDCAKGAIVNGSPFDYHFMAIIVPELSNFMSEYDKALAGLMTDLFDCGPSNEERKRGNPNAGIIPFPGISLIAGSSTSNLGATISDDMWGSGFMARVILVFSSDIIVPNDMFRTDSWDEKIEGELVLGLRRIGGLKGPMSWTTDAQLLLRDFRLHQQDNAPLHNRLAHYVTRRWLHLGKLCMIAALAREQMEVGEDDFRVALGWLTSAEAVMPDVFMDMVSHEDGQIYEEIRSAMWHEFLRRRNVPIPYNWFIRFLQGRVAHHNVERVVQIMEAADYIRRVAGTGANGSEALYVPQTPHGGKPTGVL